MNSEEERQGKAEREATKDNKERVRKRGRWTHINISLRPAAAVTSYEKLFLHMTLLLSTPVAESATRLTTSIAVPQSHYVSWQFVSEVVNTRVSIFHHTLTLGQADKWLFKNKARLNPQVSGRIMEPGMIGLFNFKISVYITYESMSSRRNMHYIINC